MWSKFGNVTPAFKTMKHAFYLRWLVGFRFGKKHFFQTVKSPKVNKYLETHLFLKNFRTPF